MHLKKILIVVSLVFISIIACKKEKFFTDAGAKLEFSVDTVQFDTVFTTIGSATQSFKVYNPYNKSIKLSSISLAKGDNSFFRLNINGVSTRRITNVEMEANDSIYIFVEVHVDPNNTNNPMIVQDSIVFETNGTFQDVKLVAVGQDVNLINGDDASGTISTNTTWNNLKPYLVYNSMLVDSNVILSISSGTKIYFHHGSRMYVKGTLNAIGSVPEPIIFRNDRLEHWYDDVPGQWVGIYFVSGSKDNRLDFCEIKNAIIGIQADTVANTNYTVEISNSKILNMNAVGIFGQGTNIKAGNCVVANCGQYALALTIGGSYEFYHCTIYNSWAYANRQTPSLVLNNYYQDVNGNYHVRPLNNAIFGNCIIYGSLENEIVFDSFNSSSTFNYKFINSLVKIADTVTTTNFAHWQNIYKNQLPGIKSPSTSDFSLDTLAYAKDKGDITIGSYYISDILGNPRTYLPDLGAYERQDNK